MVTLNFLANAAGAPTVLCLGAHSDDIEIGAGATILSIAEAAPAAKVVWAVFAGHGDREAEARESAGYFTAGFAAADIHVHQFRDGFFPQDTAALKERFEVLKAEYQPDVILTHYRDDRHQDHRTISDLTWQTFRNHLILEYEIPKYDGDFGTPNVFLPVTDEIRQKKNTAIERYFGSQRNKQWFASDTFNAVMRLRGIESNAASGYAEAFYCRKAVLAL